MKKKKEEPVPEQTPLSAPPVKYVRRIKGGKYEYGHVKVGLTRDLDKYVPVGIVGTYEAAANAQHFEPAAPHTATSGGTYYEDLHSRNQGKHTYRRA